MEKFLQTCFLALLCLAGSSSSAQSRVADSPGADFLHRSGLSVSPHSGDAHRGGETLSDTFLKYNDREEDQKSIPVTSDTESLDSCFLCLESSDSLVDQHLDPGAGKEATSLQPAPVTVFAHQISKDLETRSGTSDTESLDSCLLRLESSMEAQPAIIYGEISDKGEIGDVTLHFWPILFDPGLQNPGPQSWTVTPHRSNIFQTFIPAFDRQFRFSIPSFSAPGYISLTMEDRKFLENYLIMPGDSIMIRIDRIANSTVFTGPSAAGYRCQQELKQIALEKKLERPKTFQLSTQSSLSPEQKAMMEKSEAEFGRKSKPVSFGPDLLDELSSQIESLGDRDYLKVLDRYKDEIGPTAYNILKADALSEERYRIAYTFLKYAYPMAKKNWDTLLTESFEDFYRKNRITLDLENNDDLAYSYGYQRVKNILLLTEAAISGKEFTEVVSAIQDPTLKSKLVTAHFLDRTTMLSAGPEELKSGLSLVSEEPYLEIFTDHLQRHIPGAAIPDFELEDSLGRAVSLSQFKGKTVLVDFWLSGCKACGAFRPKLAQIAKDLSDNDNLVLLSVSLDRNRSGWEKSLSTGAYSIPGAIQLYTSELGHEHPFTAHFGISMVPHALVIGPDGTLVKSGFYPMNYQKIFPTLMNVLDTQTPDASSDTIRP